jgi:hypothetical protein
MAYRLLALGVSKTMTADLCDAGQQSVGQSTHDDKRD